MELLKSKLQVAIMFLLGLATDKNVMNIRNDSQAISECMLDRHHHRHHQRERTALLAEGNMMICFHQIQCREVSSALDGRLEAFSRGRDLEASWDDKLVQTGEVSHNLDSSIEFGKHD